MKILGLDSSGLVASVAIAEDDNLLGEYTVNYKKTHSQTLLPMLDEVARMIELDLSSIDAIAVAGGPGLIYGTSDWFGDGKRSGTRVGEADPQCADGGRTCIQSGGTPGYGMPAYGRKKKSDLYRFVPF